MTKRISKKDLERNESESTGQSQLDGMSETSTARSGGASMELTFALLWYEHAGELQKKYGLTDYNAVLDLVAARMTGLVSRENLKYVGYSDLDPPPEGTAPCTFSKEVVGVLAHAMEIEGHGDILTFKRAAHAARKRHGREYGIIDADEETAQAQKHLIDALIARDNAQKTVNPDNGAAPPGSAPAEKRVQAKYVVSPFRESENPMLQEIARLNQRIYAQANAEETVTLAARSQTYRTHIVTPDSLADGINASLGGNKTVDAWDFYGAKAPGKVQGLGQALDKQDFVSALARHFFQPLKYQDFSRPDEIAIARERGDGEFHATKDSDRREAFYDAVERFCNNVKGLDIVRGQYHARKNFSQLLRVIMSESGLNNPQMHALLAASMGDSAPSLAKVNQWGNASSQRTPSDEEAEMLADKVFAFPPAEKTEFLHSIRRARWGEEAERRLKTWDGGSGKFSGQEVLRRMFGDDRSEESVRHAAMDLHTYASVVQGVLDGNLPLTEPLSQRISNFYTLSNEPRDILAQAAQMDAKAPAHHSAKIRKYTNEVLANVKVTDSLGDVLTALFAEPNGLISPRLISERAERKKAPIDTSHLYDMAKRDISTSVHKPTTAERIATGLDANAGAADVLMEVALKRKPYISIGHTLDCYARTGNSDLHGYVESLGRDFGISVPVFAEMCGTRADYMNACMEEQFAPHGNRLGNKVLSEMDKRFALNERQEGVLRLVARGSSKQAMEQSIVKAEVALRKLGDGQHESPEGRAIATTLFNELAVHSGLTEEQMIEPLSVESRVTIHHWKQGITWTEEFVKNVDTLAKLLVGHDPALASRAADALLALPRHYRLKDLADCTEMKPDAALRAVRFMRRETREDFVASLEHMGRQIIPDFDLISRTGISYSNLTRMESGHNPINEVIATILSKMAEDGGVGVIGAKPDDIRKLRGAFESTLTGKRFLRNEQHDFSEELEQLRSTQDRQAFLVAVMKKFGHESIVDLSRMLSYAEDGKTQTVGTATVGAWLKKGSPIRIYGHAEAVVQLAGFTGNDKTDAIDLLMGRYREQEPAAIVEAYLKSGGEKEGEAGKLLRRQLMADLMDNRHFAYASFATEIIRLTPAGVGKLGEKDIQRWENNGSIPKEYLDAALDIYRVPEAHREVLKRQLQLENTKDLTPREIVARYKNNTPEMLVHLRKMAAHQSAESMALAFNKRLVGVKNDRGWSMNCGETTIRRWEKQGYFPDYALEAGLDLYRIPSSLRNEALSILRDPEGEHAVGEMEAHNSIEAKSWGDKVNSRKYESLSGITPRK
jgi:hypothetical protein